MAISPDLAEQLRSVPIEDLLEYVGQEISIPIGEVAVEVVFSNGHYRRAWVRSGPLSSATLEGRRAERHHVARSGESGPPALKDGPLGPLIQGADAA